MKEPKISTLRKQTQKLIDDSGVAVIESEWNEGKYNTWDVFTITDNYSILTGKGEILESIKRFKGLNAEEKALAYQQNIIDKNGKLVIKL